MLKDFFQARDLILRFGQVLFKRGFKLRRCGFRGHLGQSGSDLRFRAVSVAQLFNHQFLQCAQFRHDDLVINRFPTLSERAPGSKRSAPNDGATVKNLAKMQRVYILFDAYGTLVELDDFYGRLQRGFLQHNIEYSMSAIKTAAHREMRHYIDNAKTARDFDSHETLRLECAQILADALNENGANENAAKLSYEIAYRVLNASIVFAPYVETHEVLSQLKSRGVRMSVASNWDYSLPQVLRDLDLTRYFEFVQTSAQIGAEKPDAQFFQNALREIQKLHPEITPHEVVYVGDHYEKDVLAPQSLGIGARWIVRDARDIASGETHFADGVKPLRSLRDLLAIVDAVNLKSVTEVRVLDVAKLSGAAR